MTITSKPATTWPIHVSLVSRPGQLATYPSFDLRSNEDVQFNISVNHHSKASESESKGRVSILVMISSSTSGNKL